MHIHSIIIGGGISGLYAAYKMINDGYNVILIEKNDKLGGRINTIYNNNSVLEVNSGRLHKNHELLLGLIEHFNLSVIPLEKYKESNKTVITSKISNKIIKVIKESVSVFTESELKTMTFGEVCTKILGYCKSKDLQDEYCNSRDFFTANAYDTINIFSEEYSIKKSYYACHEGFDELINKMESSLFSTGKFKIFKNCEVVSLKYNKQYNYAKVIAKLHGGELRIFKSDVVISTVGKKELIQLVEESIIEYNKKIEMVTLLNTIEAIPLHKVYGKFASNWVEEMSNVKKIENDKELRTVILKDLHIVYPEVKTPKIQWIQNHYWETGVHMWKPDIDIKTAHSKIELLFGKDIPIFIVGETVSLSQSWIEGALINIEEIYNKIKPYISLNPTEVVSSIRKIPRIKESLIDSNPILQNYTHWIILKINGQRRIINTKDWMIQYDCPCGRQSLEVHNKKDITAIWPIKHYINAITKEINPSIMKIINSNTVGILI